MLLEDYPRGNRESNHDTANFTARGLHGKEMTAIDPYKQIEWRVAVCEMWHLRRTASYRVKDMFREVTPKLLCFKYTVPRFWSVHWQNSCCEWSADLTVHMQYSYSVTRFGRYSRCSCIYVEAKQMRLGHTQQREWEEGIWQLLALTNPFSRWNAYF